MGDFKRDRKPGGDRDFGRRDFGGRGRGFGGGFNRGSERREMFSTVCSNCGKDCQVPFRPTNGKPVYCSDCFEKMGGGRSDERRPERSEYRPQMPSVDQNKAQIDAINIKLDKILSILAPTPVVKEEVAEEVKPEKIKKVAKKASSTKKK